MTQHIIGPQGPLPTEPRPPERDEGLRAPPGLGPWGRFWWWLKFWLFVKTARLRFIVVLAAIGGVIAYWDTLQAIYDRWKRPAGEQTAAAAGLEFWCPMHPTIIREQPDKCPICGMPLSKRKKGEAGEEEPLPPGIVSRVQLSPYRIALAGIQTAKVTPQSLTREIRTVGFIEFDERKLARITARLTGKSRIDKLHVNVTGQLVHKGDPLAVLYNPDLIVTVQNLLDARTAGNRSLEQTARDRLRLWGIDNDQINAIVNTGKPITQITLRAPMHGHVIKKYQAEGEYVEEGARLYDLADLSTVWMEAQVYEDDLSTIRVGMDVKATTRAFPHRVFTGKVAFVQPHLDAGTRTLRVRADMANDGHDLRPGMYATATLQVSAAELEQVTTTLREDWVNRLAVGGLAPSNFIPAGARPVVGVEALLWAAPRYELLRRGLVLAVPESAVIDTGTRKIVYRVAEPGVYEGVEVQLGPRCGNFYPVLRGLEPGDEVTTAGSFLIDAETRLNPAAGSTYFGASGGPQDSKRSGGTVRPSMSEDSDSKVIAALARLSPADRQLAEAQEYCVVLENSRLGSMGVPIKLLIQGQPVFVCCKGCVKQARDSAERTLKRLQELKAHHKGTHAQKADRSEEEAEVRAALAKLSPKDRALAEAQGFCATHSDSRLGSMGKPIRVEIEGRPVFLCCESCVQAARDHPGRTLATVERLKAQVRKQKGR